MNHANTEDEDDEAQEAEEYLSQLAGHTSGFEGEYIFEDVEVPDGIAGKMVDDPRIEIVDKSKGEFGLDMGTMIMSFKICPHQQTKTDNSNE